MKYMIRVKKRKVCKNTRVKLSTIKANVLVLTHVTDSFFNPPVVHTPTSLTLVLQSQLTSQF